MSYYIATTVPVPFDKAIGKAEAALKEEGFGDHQPDRHPGGAEVEDPCRFQALHDPRRLQSRTRP